MALSYTYVQWNRAKRIYDRWIVIGVLSYLLLFFGLSLSLDNEKTAETVLIRAFGSLALLMLHIILLIGPLARLNPAFLPLLYNRRHFGVSMFLIALVHGGISIFQYHALGELNPIWALFTSNPEFGSLLQFPFQVLGFFALLILGLMATTSHDFFLSNLNAKVWKALHMLVYFAYVLILAHVLLGTLQQERNSLTLLWMGFGFILVLSSHLLAAIKEARLERSRTKLAEDGWLNIGSWQEIPDKEAVSISFGGSRVAVFRDGNKFSAVHSRCKHQGGPLEEGKIIDGCITCPWHGYQYLPENGQSPPPFKEKLATYELKLSGDQLFLKAEAKSEGTHIPALEIKSKSSGDEQ